MQGKFYEPQQENSEPEKLEPEVEVEHCQINAAPSNVQLAPPPPSPVRSPSSEAYFPTPDNSPLHAPNGREAVSPVPQSSPIDDDEFDLDGICADPVLDSLC